MISFILLNIYGHWNDNNVHIVSVISGQHLLARDNNNDIRFATLCGSSCSMEVYRQDKVSLNGHTFARGKNIQVGAVLMLNTLLMKESMTHVAIGFPMVSDVCLVT